jgi:hypothetical protein
MNWADEVFEVLRTVDGFVYVSDLKETFPELGDNELWNILKELGERGLIHSDGHSIRALSPIEIVRRKNESEKSDKNVSRSDNLI